MFAVWLPVNICVVIGTSCLYIMGSLHLEEFLRISTPGDITRATITRKEKKRIYYKELEEKRKVEHENKKKRRKTDFKMGTCEFKNDGLPSKNELQRVNSPFNFKVESPDRSQVFIEIQKTEP